MMRNAAERETQASAGCGSVCEAGASGSLNDGASRAETQTPTDPSVNTLDAGPAGVGGARPTPRDAAPRIDGGVSADADDADSGSRIPVEAGTATPTSAPPDENGFCSACDSATPTSPVLNDSGGTGNVTTFGSVDNPSPSEGGACNYGRTRIAYYAAINANVQGGTEQGQWQGGRICGQCAAVRVKTQTGWKETVVRIVDKCSDPYCGIALAGAPAKELMGQRPGRYQGNWRFVSCQGHPEVSDGPPAIHVKEGSSEWWAQVQVRNPMQAVTGVDWQSATGESGTFPYSVEAENYFSVPEAVRNLDMVHLTINYGDKTNVTLDVSVNQLTTPEANIPLP